MKQKAATSTAAKWIPKDGSENEAPGNKSDGQCIDKLIFLKFFEITLQEGKDQNEKVVDLGLTERLPEERKSPATRIGQRDAKRERVHTGGSDEIVDQVVQTPGGTQISLATAMQDRYGGDAHPAQAAATMEMHTAMMAYLSGMYGGMAYSAAPVGGYTTVMLRNIPNRYTRDMLIERVDVSYKGQYDFVYLPVDFNSKCNVGYAFVNFCTADSAAAFTQEFHGKRTKTVLPGFSSAKVCEVSYARVQGRDANMENLRDERFVEKLAERPEWQPLFFDDGGKEIPFSNTLGTSGVKRKSSRAVPASPPGYMWPVPMMYPPVEYAAPPPEPAVTLSSVLPSATAETMLMLKEVPLAFTQEELLGHLDKSHKGAYDFLWLPKDFKADVNRGFAFINIRSKEQAEQFSKDFNGVKAFGDEADEEKPCEVTSARLNSLEGSIARAQSSKAKAAGQKEKWGPVLVSEDGKMKPLPLLSPSLGGKGQGKGPDTGDQVLIALQEGEGKKRKKKGEGKGKQPNPWAFPPANLIRDAGRHMAAMHHHVAAMQVASMVAHTQARVAASKHAHGDVLVPPKPALFTPTEQAPLTQDKKEQIFKQIEFYFSTQNLCKDVYLRKQMDDATGYVPLQVISEFPKVRKLGAAMADIVEVLAASETLELDESSALIRLKDEAERNRWKAPVMSRQTSTES